jgi:parallel beta-helix repeat protein
MTSNKESSTKTDERSQIEGKRIARRDFLKWQSLVALAPVAMVIGQKLGGGIVFANSVVSQQTSQQTSSYTVYIDTSNGNLVKALNNTTGNIDYSNQNATQVIQYAINALPKGGKIVINGGTYVLSSSLQSNGISGIELCGQGNATVLRLANSVNHPVLAISSVNNWHVHDLQIDGNKANQASTSQSSYGIATWKCANIVIENCYVHDCRTFGIGMSYGTNSTIQNNEVDNSGANGITIDNQEGGGGITVQGNVVNGASDVGSQHGSEAMF